MADIIIKMLQKMNDKEKEAKPETSYQKKLRTYDKEIVEIAGFKMQQIQAYLHWFGSQPVSLLVIMMRRQMLNYRIKSFTYAGKYTKRVIYIASLVETISLFCESEKRVTEVDFTKVWYDEKDIKQVRSLVKNYRNAYGKLKNEGN